MFPDARFVMTHRDPTDVMVSVADLYCEVGQQFSDDVDPHYLGRLNVEQWSTGMDRVLAFRDAHGDDRFHDIDFRAMQRDPVGEVRGLYAWLGEPVSDAFADGMERWWHANNDDRDENVHPDADGVRPRPRRGPHPLRRLHGPRRSSGRGGSHDHRPDRRLRRGPRARLGDASPGTPSSASR